MKQKYSYNVTPNKSPKNLRTVNNVLLEPNIKNPSDKDRTSHYDVSRFASFVLKLIFIC